MRATDRARERIQHTDCVPMEECPHDRARNAIAWLLLPAALDFADAVEAALDPAHIPERRAHLCREALRAFLAQLDRATGGGA